MALSFDPAIEAQAAFQLAQARNELGPDGELARDLEAVFSGSAGEDAALAYRRLLVLGESHGDARAFQEFLIYSTWQQAAEDPIPEHFHRGRDLCARFLAREQAAGDGNSLVRVQALRTSFLDAIGEREQDEIGEEYDRDAFKGGD
jgi:hypothetical protein